MPLDHKGSHRWAEPCDLHDAAKREVEAAFAVVLARIEALGAGRSDEQPTVEELERLENARSKRDAIERQMDDFVTTLG